MNLVLAEVFADPLRYSEKFSRIDKELADTDEDDAAKAEPPAVDGACESPLASLCKGLSKAGHFAGELLLDLYGGEFDVTLIQGWGDIDSVDSGSRHQRHIGSPGAQASRVHAARKSSVETCC
jgi:hypothetical protein